jgi:GT2 family glycosyltransferase
VHGTGLASPDEEACVSIPISVMMLSRGSAEMSATAVKSLQDTAIGEFQLVFVDNGSDKSEKLSDAITPILSTKDIFVRNEVNRSVARATNQAASLSDGVYLLWLNNDIVAHGDWQTPLLTEGVKYDLCGPTVRQIGIVEELKAMMCRRENGVMADAEPSSNGAYVEGWCLFIRRDYYKYIGGLDEVFWPMYCEDTDLSFRVVATGGKLGKVPVPIRHIGSVDTMKYYEQRYKETLNMANNYKLYARWVQGAIL